MADVAMPRLSDSMEEGTILKWLKSDGDEVEKGEELVEIETDKANMTYEADESGTLSIVAKEGDTLAVGETICTLGEGGGAAAASGDEDEEDAAAEENGGDEEEEAAAEENGGDEEEDEEEAVAEENGGDEEEDEEEAAAAEAKGEDEEKAAAEENGGDEEEDEEEAEEEPAAAKGGDEEDEKGGDEEEAEPAAKGDGDADSGGDGRVKASPVARRMARELGVELARLEGSGPGGRIVKADVEAAAEQDGDEAADEQEQKAEKKEEAPKREQAAARSGDAGTGRGETDTEELTRLQQTVARRMAESKATAPDFVITCEVDMEEAVAFRGQLRAAAGEDPAPSFNDLVVKASALALKEFPRANGAYRDGKFELYSRVNVGVAVAGQDALVVPTVFDADRKSLGEIARDARALAERVREGKVTPPELSSGTFTVSNLGMFGITRFTAVINPPQAAILAVGEMKPRPVVRDGEVVVRVIMELTLSCDHRILYGADAARFLGRIRERLENPVSLVL
jgi:pyruvate dehydrogenase E2 component (dihydrolipoamide acetyltransferase)